MPTYEYECKKCKKHFEFFQLFSEPEKKACPDKKCKGKLERLVTGGGGILFKGSGFYQTDYRSPEYRKKHESEKKESEKKPEIKTTEKKTEKTPKSGEAKTETKKAKKTE